jgi:hypothetical protein
MACACLAPAKAFSLAALSANRKPRPLDPCIFLTPAQHSAHPTPALVARTQGGLTLGPDGGELDVDFCKLGTFWSHSAITFVL